MRTALDAGGYRPRVCWGLWNTVFTNAAGSALRPPGLTSSYLPCDPGQVTHTLCALAPSSVNSPQVGGCFAGRQVHAHNTELSFIYIKFSVKSVIVPVTRKLCNPWGCPGWLCQLSIQLSVSAQVVISQLVGSSPTRGSVLPVRSLLGILSLPLSLCSSLVHTRSLSLSQNKHFFKRRILYNHLKNRLLYIVMDVEQSPRLLQNGAI